MEKLNPQQLQSIQKMSSDRLKMKLIKAGMSEDVVEQMDRPALLEAWAELVLEGKDKPPEVSSPTVPAGYDPQLERQKWEFQMKQWEEEREERRRCEEVENRKWQFQLQRWEEEKRGADEEIEERRRKEEAEIELRRRELELREREVKAQLDRDKEKKSLVDRAKRYGNALKGIIARMPTDPVDLLSYFRDVEQQFDLFEVPVDLRVEILRPHLSDKANLLVSKMDPRQNINYKEVKQMLLREFKLSPAVYLDRFNTESRKADETYLLYSARLRSILDAYLESRMVAKHPERIPDLLVCDRLKSTLPVACLNYVLSVEAAKDKCWLPPHILVETIDTYFFQIVAPEATARVLALLVLSLIHI